MWQTKYALAVPKNLGVGVDLGPCSEGYCLSASVVRGSDEHLYICGTEGTKMVSA